MQMERGLDSGPVFKELRLPLDGSEYADSLEMSLGELAAQHAVEILHGIADGSLPSVPQNPAEVTICRKISKRDGMINWMDDAKDIEAMTRAFFPWPGATAKCTDSNGKEINISICSAGISDTAGLLPGECADISGKIIVGCGNSSALEIRELIPSGGKRMTAAAFRNGLRGELPSFIIEAEI
jgi:methionyl-tRNA formyltransferase